MALYTAISGESLHDSLLHDIRHARARDGSAPGLRFLPGTVFTDGEFLYEVVYGVQGLGHGTTAGWVAAARTDYIDHPDSAPDNYCYSLFGWNGHAQDGAIIAGGRRAAILRLVKAAPRLLA